MKISPFFVAAISIGSTATAFEFGERELQTCPSPSDTVACTLDLDPVKCGINACPYDNLCTAGAAGFTPSRCWPSTCKTPAADTACTFESTPVKCGDEQCSYANYCEAGAAGFPPPTCVLESCAIPDQTNAACTAEYDPVACLEGGLCYYDNGCLASLAGFDPSPSAGKCVRVIDVPANLPTCPVVPADVVCTYEYDPRRCGGDSCVYSNTCESTEAGFTDADCQSTNCRVPAADTVCTADFDPVTCGNLNCEYSNMCGAMASGYAESECSSNSCPSTEGSACTRDYKPSLCGEGCVYDNDCLAEAAGFTALPTAGDCAPITDPNNPPECPAQGQGGACTSEFNEKQCGPLGCFYSNQCQADAAGYSEGMCWQAYCAPPTSVDECGSEVDSITCGPYDCLYGNRCLGNRAGWAPAECSPVSCPATPEGSACSLEYDPIICNSNLVSSGITCAYSNACLAGAAGYATEAYAGQCIYASLIQPGRAFSEPVPLQTGVTNGTDTTGTETTEPGTTTTEPGTTTAPDATPSPTPSAAPAKVLAFASALALAVSAIVM